jgi:DNA (cytosine-5)-methyltransferase 1
MHTEAWIQKLGDYLTVKEAAEFIGVSPNAFRNWDRTDKLKPLRHPVNRYRLYRKEDVEQLLLEAATNLK